jgi:hypothetical protein
VDGKTAAAYLDLLADLLLVRRLPGSAPEGVQGYFYQSSGGAEIDLLLS